MAAQSESSFAAVTSPGFLAGVIDCVGHPVFVKDRSFRFVLVNHALCEMVGHRREAMLGRTDHDFFAKAESDLFRLADEQVVRTRQQLEIAQEEITDASGARHVLATTKVPLFSAGGEVTHVVGIIHDITRLKAAEDALRLANEELERRVAERTAALEAAQGELVRTERLALLGQLAGGIAHQIRNPLATIANAAALLKRAARATPELNQPIEIILEEVFRANRTITGLLDHARVRPAFRTPVSVVALVDQALAACQVPSAVKVVRELGNEEIAVDADQLREALINLVQNASEAMAGGGTLTLCSRREAGEVVVELTDTGSGVAPEILPELFQPLVTTKPLGIGLGLTTARTLVENQGGELTYRRSDGAGACFALRLPAA